MPDTAIAPAPAPAPAPTPSPAPPPSPSPSPSPTPSETRGSEESKGGDSAFDRLESRLAPKPKPEAKKTETPPPDKTEKPTTPTPPPKEERKLETPKALREAHDRAIRERDESMGKIKAYEAKISEYESKGKDATALISQLEAEKKEKESLQAEIRMLKKEVSPDFKDKWDKPFERTVGRAMNDIKNMVVLGEKDIDGNPIGQDRQAVWEDFQNLYAMPINKAIAASRKMFGPDASTIVEQYLIKLKDMDFDRQNALQEEREKWKEMETRETAQAAQKKEAFQKASDQARQNYVSQHPDWYDEDPNDPEGNELLRLGHEAIAYQPKTFEEAAKIFERNKLNAAAFPRMADRLEKAKSKIAELEAVIAEFKGSGPGTTRRTTQGTPASEGKSWEEEMREAANA